MALHVMEEASRCLGCKKPRCREGCPIHTNIPEAIRLLKDGKLNEAGRMLFENNPLTTVCSIVCNHEKQCEGHCIRGIKDVPVHFSVIENYISTTYANQMVNGPAPSNGRKVALIGAGPSSLTIAVILARYGYNVTIFDTRDKIGGVMRYGIPDFRLPDAVLDDFAYRHLELKGIKFRPPIPRSAARSAWMICSGTAIRASSSAPASGGRKPSTSRGKRWGMWPSPSTISPRRRPSVWASV